MARHESPSFSVERPAGSGWLYRIVANAAYEKLRARRGRRVDRPLDEVNECPVDYRAVLVLHDVEDWSPLRR